MWSPRVPLKDPKTQGYNPRSTSLKPLNSGLEAGVGRLSDSDRNTRVREENGNYYSMLGAIL